LSILLRILRGRMEKRAPRVMILQIIAGFFVVKNLFHAILP
jgi:hypothetical protein